jgi:hypothetical protein
MINTKFDYSLTNVPFTHVSPKPIEAAIFQKHLTSLVRVYLKMSRRNGGFDRQCVIGCKYGIALTAEEVAILIIRRTYDKRKL